MPGGLIPVCQQPSYGWLLSFVKDFQWIIGAAVGFAGVMLTLWFNAWLQRAQERGHREHDQATLRRALREELWIILEATRGYIEKSDPERMKSLQETNFSVSLRSLTPFFDQVGSKLGLLDEAEIGPVLSAVDVHKHSMATLGLVAEIPEREVLRDGFLVVSIDNAAAFNQRMTVLAAYIENALVALGDQHANNAAYIALGELSENEKSDNP